jgi:serine/threonine-protein kinase
VILFELLTGQRPFTGTTPTSVMFAVVQQDAPVPSSVDAKRNVSPAWDSIVLKAMAKKPEERYPSAAELADAVRAVSAK